MIKPPPSPPPHPIIYSIFCPVLAAKWKYMVLRGHFLTCSIAPAIDLQLSKEEEAEEEEEILSVVS